MKYFLFIFIFNFLNQAMAKTYDCGLLSGSHDLKLTLTTDGYLNNHDAKRADEVMHVRLTVGSTGEIFKDGWYGVQTTTTSTSVEVGMGTGTYYSLNFIHGVNLLVLTEVYYGDDTPTVSPIGNQVCNEINVNYKSFLGKSTNYPASLNDSPSKGEYVCRDGSSYNVTQLSDNFFPPTDQNYFIQIFGKPRTYEDNHQMGSLYNYDAPEVSFRTLEEGLVEAAKLCQLNSYPAI